MEIRKLIIWVVPFVLTACGSTGVYPVGGDVFFVSQRSWQLELGFTPVTKATVLNEAENFCADQHKRLDPLKMQVDDSLWFTNGRVAMTFRCVDSPDSSD